MACSEARLAANRANALKSTGPRTDEGKEASRRNSLKHGLTGAGVVVPGEDAEEVARESAAFLVELAGDGLPSTRLLAERVATLAVRLRRSARHELAATAERARVAAADFDEARVAEAGRLFEAIDEGSNRADLLAMPEGVDLLDATLGELRAVAVAAAWSGDDSDRLARCLVGDRAGGPLEPGQVVELIDAERARLAAARPKLDHAGIARARVEAVDLVLVDDEPETLRARRYEAATERSLFRALREIREARKSAAEPSTPFPSSAELVRQAEASRRQLARVELAPATAHVPPLGSSFPAMARPAAAGYGLGTIDPNPAPRGRSRYEDRKQRPKLGR